MIEYQYVKLIDVIVNCVKLYFIGYRFIENETLFEKNCWMNPLWFCQHILFRIIPHKLFLRNKLNFKRIRIRAL